MSIFFYIVIILHKLFTKKQTKKLPNTSASYSFISFIKKMYATEPSRRTTVCLTIFMCQNYVYYILYMAISIFFKAWISNVYCMDVNVLFSLQIFQLNLNMRLAFEDFECNGFVKFIEFYKFVFTKNVIFIKIWLS